ncbi:glycosyl transferase [Bacteroidia bacterium]|nr:glycosyl transferase [Bacteroidia bacterium]
MKILILSTSERNGGAAIAANRLMHALNKAGQEAKMLVRDKQTKDERVVSINTNWFAKKINFIRFAWERWVIFVHNRFNKKNLFAVSIANTGTDISKHPLVQEADILHLHWLNQGFLSLKNIRQLIATGKPVVWTMHDMWAGTGICHYSRDCMRFTDSCCNCPYLRKSTKNDLSHKMFVKKNTLFLESNIHFVGCSHWIAEKAKASWNLRHAAISNIPNPIDTTLFRPFGKATAREKFNLPVDKKLILFAAAKLSDTRKGMDYFVEACRSLLVEVGNMVEVVLLGGKMAEQLVLPLKTNPLGYLKTPSDIVAAYAACDIFVIPSLEDNLPNTVMEAMACGTPCVGFNVGGIPEMIDHKKNGYVAEYKSASDLAAGILWVLDNVVRLSLSEACVKKVLTNYAEAVVAKQYTELYESMLDTKKD